jgi:hypothetical protein
MGAAAPVRYLLRMAGVVVLIWIVAGGVCGVAGFVIGNMKGRGVAGFWLGFLFGVFGLIVIAVIAPTPLAEAERRAQIDAAVDVLSDGPSESRAAPTRRPCPWCAEFIRLPAIVCRYCGRDVEPLAAGAAPPDPIDAPDRQRAYSFLRDEHPTSFDTVWEAASQFPTWPRLPTPALRAACQAVENGTPSLTAVKAAFAAAR